VRWRRGLQAAAIAVLAALLGGRWLAVRTASTLWAGSLGVGATHAHFARMSTALAGSAFLVAVCWCVGNLLLVYRSIRAVHVPRKLGNLEIVEAVPRPVLLVGAIAIGAALAAALSHGAGGWWYARALAQYTAELGFRDPVLGRDVSYYLFHLPWQRTLHTFFTLLTGVVLLVVATLYLAVGAVRRVRRRLRVTDLARWHLAILSAAFAVALFWGYRLEPAEYAAGIHDVPADAILTAVRIPVARMLSVVALVVVLGSLLWLWTGRLVTAVLAWVLLGGASFAGHYVVPSFSGAVRSADELVLPEAEARRRQFEQVAFGSAPAETPIDRAGELGGRDGRPGGGLEDGGRVVWDGFAVTVLLDRAASSEAHETFSEAGLGLYVASDGAPVPVYVSARLVDVAAARDEGVDVTWDLVHAGAFATGRGVAAVLASAVTETGLPRFVPDLARPESLSNRQQDVVLEDETIVVAPGFTDFAVFAPDAGRIGVRAGGLGRRLALAWSLQSPALLTSERVADSSTIAWDRDVTLRLERLAPFARFGQPRPVIDGGRLYWLSSGYVSADGFPLATRARWRELTVRYLRSSFVGVVDAATGATAVYLGRDADPLSLAWSQLAPQIVRPAAQLPATLRTHLAYPEELLTAQLPLLQRSIFPSTLVGRPLVLPAADGAPLGREPYWWVGPTAADTVPRLRLLVPLEDRESGLLAGLLDATMRESVPVLELYRPEASDQVLGPVQIARQFARARGDLAGIEGVVRLLPLEVGVLALQSLYVSDDQDGGAPQLIDVSVGLRGAVGSGPGFEEAVRQLSAEVLPSRGGEAEWGQARVWFQRMDAARRAGDWGAFGRAYDQLRRLLVGGGEIEP
jgi:hypothetical protein